MSSTTHERDLTANPPCHPRACAIQDCLVRNGYQESRCKGAILALYRCCDAFYKKNGDQAISASCPKAELLRLKMEQEGIEGAA